MHVTYFSGVHCGWLIRNVRFGCRAKQSPLVVDSKSCRKVPNSDLFRSLFRFVQSIMTAVNSVLSLQILLNYSTLIYFRKIWSILSRNGCRVPVKDSHLNRNILYSPILLNDTILAYIVPIIHMRNRDQYQNSTERSARLSSRGVKNAYL